MLDNEVKRQKGFFNMDLFERVDYLFEDMQKNEGYDYHDETKNDAKSLIKKYLPFCGGENKGVAPLVATYLACEKCACPIPIKIVKRYTFMRKKFNEELKFFREQEQQFYPTKAIYWMKGLRKRIENKLEYSKEDLDKLFNEFRRLANRYEELPFENKKPLASVSSRYLAIGILYVASVISNVRISQHQLELLFFQTEVSIRRVSRNIVKALGIDLEAYY